MGSGVWKIENRKWKVVIESRDWKLVMETGN
jgi:hypothetical protein